MGLPQKKMPSVMGPQHSFAQVPSVGVDRSVFDRSHGYKTTFDAGFLIPVLVDYVIPGVTISCRLSALARLTTPFKPLMDNMYLDTFFFFVPFRLLWANFQKFMGEQVNPGDSISFTVPVASCPAGGYPVGTLADYYGLPTVGQVAGGATFNHSALPHRAYVLIYNQWFRDENLVNSATVGGIVNNTTDGPDGTTANTSPFKRGKRHDYFTSCLPFLQKGTQVSAAVSPTTSHAVPTFWNVTSNNAAGQMQRSAPGAATAINIQNAGAGGEALGWLAPNLSILLSDLRLAIQTQQFLERDARGGTRYIEIIYSHFKVKSDDARLQRPEYLGGGSSPVNITPIVQQTQTGLTGGNTPIGNLSGVGAAVANGHGFHKSFTEHGVLMGIVNVRADLTYSQGLERFWSYSTRYDFPWPDFAFLSEQAVLNKELYLRGDANDDLVFGYQERYAECRYKPSKVTGLFRPTAAGTLQIWHLSEKFTALPTLGQTFIEDQTETVLDDRVAVPSEPDFYFDGWFDYKCARPLPVFGVPRLSGRL